MKIMLPRVFAIGAVALPLCACGTADYQAPIKSFADATGAAQTSLNGYVEAVVSQARKDRAAEAVENSAGVQVMPGDCLVQRSTRCRIVYKSAGDSEPVPISPESPISNVTAIMDAIKTYADGLQAIATSDSADKAKASLAATGDSLQTLAGLIGGKESNLGAFAGPTAEAAAWIAGAYLDRVRLDALREATGKADGLIGEAVPIFDGAVTVISDAAKIPLANAVTDSRRAFKDHPTESSLDGLLAAAAAYDAVLTAKPETVFDNLAKAHHELTAALHSRDLNLAAVIARMEALSAQAQELQKIVAGFVAAVKKE